MFKDVKKRVSAWKKFYTQDLENLDENSSWKEIFTALDLMVDETVDMFYLASGMCGTFNSKESIKLHSLPCYTETIDFLCRLNSKKLKKLSFCTPNGDTVFCEFFPQAANKLDRVAFIEVTIVPVSDIPDIGDTYIFNENLTDPKNIVIKYSKEPPKDWLAGEINR